MEKTVLVYAAKRPSAVEAAKKVGMILRHHGMDYQTFSLSEFIESDIPLKNCLVIVLGGDGTVLRVARKITSDDVKLLGINFGRAGYLCAAESHEVEMVCNKVCEGKYDVEKVMRLAVSADGEFLAYVLNEAYISANIPGKIIEYQLKQDEQIINDVADGVILSTPVGSTAYALSAGGPIVDESIEAVVVVPMASMTNLRPLVLSIHRPLIVKVVKGESQIIVDGHTTKKLSEGIVMVKKSESSLAFITFDDRRFFTRRLRKRLYGKT